MFLTCAGRALNNCGACIAKLAYRSDLMAWEEWLLTVGIKQHLPLRICHLVLIPPLSAVEMLGTWPSIIRHTYIIRYRSLILSREYTEKACTFGPNLVILAWTGDQLSCRQAQNGVTFDFEVKFDLEGQGQSLPKTIGILTKVFYTCGPNLVILAWTGDELSHGQAHDWRMDGHTDRQTQATTVPEGQNWPRVKTYVLEGSERDCKHRVSQVRCAGTFLALELVLETSLSVLTVLCLRD